MEEPSEMRNFPKNQSNGDGDASYMRRRFCKYNRSNDRLSMMRSASERRQASGSHVLAVLPREAVRRRHGRMMRVIGSRDLLMRDVHAEGS